MSNARAEANRKNGARSRGPKTPEGKARSSQNALKHGLRAHKYVVLPQEDAAEFAELEAALLAELAPVGALQTVLARRVALAAWRLARADRLAAGTGLVPRRRTERGRGPIPQPVRRRPTRRPTGRRCSRSGAGTTPAPGSPLIRDGNGTHSFETLLRYRGAAMAEFGRALRTLKVLQAKQAAETGPALDAHRERRAPRRVLTARPQPNEPERGATRRLECAPPDPPIPGRTPPEPAAPWTPKEPEPRGPDELPDRRDRPHGSPEMRATESQGRMDRLNKCRAQG